MFFILLFIIFSFLLTLNYFLYTFIRLLCRINIFIILIVEADIYISETRIFLDAPRMVTKRSNNKSFFYLNIWFLLTKLNIFLLLSLILYNLFFQFTLMKEELSVVAWIKALDKILANITSLNKSLKIIRNNLIIFSISNPLALLYTQSVWGFSDVFRMKKKTKKD